MLEGKQRRATRSARVPSRSRESGQALLELALVAPIIILLLMGLIQFALIFERQIGINNAVREAARRAATFDTPDSATASTNAAWTLTTLQSLLGNSQAHETSRDVIEVCIVTPAAPYDVDASGNEQVVVRIKASYRHPLFLPIVTQIIDGIDGANDSSLLASTSTEFHVEQAGSHNIGTGGFARTTSDATPCVR
jgi:Flp pilus assembly protein TadG